MRQHFPEESNYSPCIIIQGNQKINQHKSMKKITDLIGNVNIPGIEKLFRIMKLTSFFLLISVVSVLAGKTYSQTKLLTLNFEKASVKELLSKIEDQSEFYFMYSEKIVDINREVSVNVENQKIETVLNTIFTGTDVNYTVKDRIIVLTTPEVFDNSSQVAFQQNSVSGKVTDTRNQPLPGVTVVVKGTSQGNVTNMDGNYTLLNIPENATLVFSFVGMKFQEVIVGSQTSINLVMEEESIGLEEVVAIGYGTQKKVNVVGSISTVSSEEISVSPVANVSNAIAGRLPGAVVKQLGGEPGYDNAQIRIRGNSTLGNKSALIVVDGIQDRDLNSIAASDIESITILKDASAGIYGARAANGVILITTKRGLERTPLFEFNAYQGWETPTKLPEMADAATYAQLIREVQTYRGVTENNLQFSLEDVEKYKSGEFPWTHPNSDYFDAAFKDFTNSNHIDFKVSGGSRDFKYYSSFSKQTNNGIYKANSTTFDRYNFTGNFEYSLLKNHLTIGLGVQLSQEDRMYPTKSANQIMEAAIRNKPTQAAIWPNGLPGPDIEYGDQPVISSSFETGFDDDKRYRGNNLLSFIFKVPYVEGLSFSGHYAYDMYFQVRKRFEKPVTLYFLDTQRYLADGNTGKEDGSEYLSGSVRGTIPEPRLTDYYNDSKTTTGLLKLEYDKSFNELHNLNMFIAAENRDYLFKGIDAFRRYFISDALPYLFAGGDAEKNNSSNISIDARLNYFGRFSYNYNQKYLFEFTFRRDGSLRFSEDAGRWGNFPSVLVGWRISDENFWKNNINFINYFKLRASYGQMGNDAVAAFQYLTSYQFGTGIVSGSSKKYNSALSQAAASNPYITWEVANIYNAGFESYLFDSKIHFDVDAFYQRRSQILVKRQASVPNFTGISLPDENFGIVDNKGFEVVLGYDNQVNDFAYSINGHLAFNRNTIIEYDEPVRKVSWQERTGHPIGAQLLYKNIGVFRDEEHVASYPHVNGARPGDLIILDYNNDEVINSDDMILFDKTGDPEITYGLTFKLSLKNFQLTGLIQGVGNSYARMPIDERAGEGGNYLNYFAEGRWTPDNPDANKPRIFNRTNEYWKSTHITDYDFNNLAYARMKNLELSYTIPTRNIKYVNWLKNAKVYITGQNLFFLYQDFDWDIDPELGSAMNYPLMKTYAIGLNISF